MESVAQGYPYVDLPADVAVTSPEAIAPVTLIPRVQPVEIPAVAQPPSKRIIDVAVASVALVALIPAFVLLMVAVAIDTRAKPVFVQVRTGRGGKSFRMYKLRTMVADAEARLEGLRHLNEVQWPMFKMRNDPRITRLGRFLRAASLDELPQLINIIKGEMSLVGPRPPLPHEVSTYTAEQARRLAVLPGLTGLWQVSGRADCSFEQAVALDLQYIERQSLRTDISIILRTFGAVLRGKGAY